MQVRALSGQEHIHGPMPEVNAIADRTEPNQRPERQSSRDVALLTRDGAGNESERAELSQPKAASIQERIGTAKLDPGGAQAEQRQHAEHVERARRADTKLMLRSNKRCERGAQQ